MAIRAAINHRTRYRFPRPVWLSPHVLRLRPAPHCRTPVLSYSLKVTPSDHFINWHQDPFSNRLARLVFPKQTRELAIEVDLVAELTVINPFDFFLDKSAEQYPFEYDPILAGELASYLVKLPATPKLTELVREMRREKLRTIDYLVMLNQDLQKRIKYLIRLEPGVQSPEHTLTLRSGSCRDTSWLLVQLARNLGLAARFVSGYLIQLKPDVKALDGPTGTDRDFTDLHAWAEIYIPGGGWIGLDPTSGLLAGEGHIPLACTADPTSASPVTGFFSFTDEDVVEVDPEDGADHGDGTEDDFEFSMTVTRLHEDPRVTKPYTDEEWIKIETLGRQVDAELAAGDVRLTMGGEPTFISVDDMDGAEWNTAAVGPKKYELGNQLLRRLRDRFAPKGLLHFGQGKWYPGEALPRWALGLYWRKDGQPVWKNPALVADENKASGAVSEDARHFVWRLAQKLGVQPRHAQPAFEDAFYYLWKERRLPVNVDPFESKLENKEDRKRLAKVFEQGLTNIIGYALPLRRVHYTDGTGSWASGEWFFRPERMYLLPGDSPMGYRLPLDSLPWALPEDRLTETELDPWAARRKLPGRDEMSRQRYMVIGHPETFAPDDLMQWHMEQEGTELAKKRPVEVRDHPPGPGEAAPWLVRTALCAEPRNGALRIFMPPQRYLEDYLELVAAIEDTAQEMNLPVALEGYTPPNDPRLNVMKVTPDPGVIEVNTHPSGSWDDLVKNTDALYEEAHLCRLGTEKFMIDGRHTGTGGGNHIIIGGATPADSPLLRRPDLLKSLVGYWHNHPALSYLFSGMFVGPTSQAPRIDDARNDQVYELEIAFNQVPKTGECPPWLVDRIFRNLLVDATGNTHRAEFCIDKLYAPETASGRLGLLEMRAFEMPPHARMSLTQHLLLRALVAQFWKAPYDRKPVRWRTEIHDRYLLPHFVKQDFEDVVEDLNRGGFPLKAEWFAPHMEFRFPQFGTIEQRGVQLELRQAIEPWNVLGEEPAGGGTVRYVDSSVERLQVLVNGMTDSRHVVSVNGVRVPMHPTGTNGQFVAGVRYRAWQPPNCLHPTIEAHTPLVFDIVDLWSDRSIGGCSYHVAHPGGRSHERFPVNSYEAEGRRLARFFKFGHTPGVMRLVEPPASGEFPMTLDLRRS